MYTGWLAYAGVEITNSTRVAKYAQTAGLPVRDCDACEGFHEVVGDEPYRTPFADAQDCPWYDAHNPDSWDFLGFMLMETEGVEDGTLTGTATELLTDGGYVSQPRHAGKEMVFRGHLFASTQAGASYGMAWLKAVLAGDTCRENGSCTGDHLCFLTDCPEMCEDSPALSSPTLTCPRGEEAEYPDACVLPYERHIYKVTTTTAPTRTAETRLSAGWMWDVEWTMYAAVPHVYATPRWVGTTELSDVGGTGEVIRTNLARNPRGNLTPDAGWVSDDSSVAEDWTKGYIGPQGTYGGGYVRKNWAIDPRATRPIGTEVLGPGRLLRTNLCPNPRYIGQDGKAGGGSASWTQEDVATGGPDGFGWTRVTATADQTGVVDTGTDNSGRAAVTPGQTYVVSLHMLAEQPMYQFFMYIQWQDENGAGINTENGGTLPDPPVGEWQRLSMSPRVAPEGAVYARVTARLSYDVNLPLRAGESYGVACRMVEQADTLGPYFDGDYVDTRDVDYSWADEPNASASMTRAMDDVIATEGLRVYRPADGEVSETVPVAEVFDGPQTASGRIDTYLRTTVTQGTGDPLDTSVLQVTTDGSALEVLPGDKWAGSAFVRPSVDIRAQIALHEASYAPTYGPVTLLPGGEWTRLTFQRTAGGALTRTNLNPNPRWIGNDGKLGGGGVTGDWTQVDLESGAPDGGGYTQFTVGTAPTGNVQFGTDTRADTAVVAGQIYSASLYAYTTRGVALRARLHWFDASHTVITQEVSVWITEGTDSWQRYVIEDRTAPAGAVIAQVRIEVRFQNEADPLQPGDLAGVAQRMIEQAETAGPYFDGGYEDTATQTFMWDGEENTSPSRATALPTTAQIAVIWDAPPTGATLDATGFQIDDWPEALDYLDGTRPSTGDYRYQWDGPEDSSTTSQVPYISDSPEGVGFQWARAFGDADRDVMARSGVFLSDINPDSWYGVRLWLYVPAFPEPNMRPEVLGQWTDAVGNPTRTPVRLWFDSSPDVGWNLVTAKTGLAPATARGLMVMPTWAAREGGVRGVRDGQTLAWAAVIIEENRSPEDYFDGETPDDRQWEYDWTGAQWDSASTKAVQAESVIIDEIDCEPDEGTPPLVDPRCTVPAAPRSPLVLDDCLILPEQWRRYQLEIPVGSVPEWTDGVPVIRLRSAISNINQIRFRFYANPLNKVITPDTVLGCDFCGELVVSYLPKGSLLVIDGVEQNAWVETYDPETVKEYGTQRLSATHLLYASDGGPVEWPTLNCDMPYSMTADVSYTGLTNVSASLCIAVRA